MVGSQSLRLEIRSNPAHASCFEPPSIWLLGHVLFYLWEVAGDICSPSVIRRDFPAVILPAIIGALLTFRAIRQ